jgi:hypothetical protein
MAGEQHELRAERRLPELFQQRQAVHDRHDHVAYDQIDPVRTAKFQRLRAVFAAGHQLRAMALPGKRAQLVQYGQFIVDRDDLKRSVLLPIVTGHGDPPSA